MINYFMFLFILADGSLQTSAAGTSRPVPSTSTTLPVTATPTELKDEVIMLLDNA